MMGIGIPINQRKMLFIMSLHSMSLNQKDDEEGYQSPA
jgi:hypothetical protein